MFFRRKRSGRTEYLQIVKNERVDGKPRQSVVATLGWVDEPRRTAPSTGCCARAHGNRAEPAPVNRLCVDLDRGKGDVPDKLAFVLCDQRYGKGATLSEAVERLPPRCRCYAVHS